MSSRVMRARLREVLRVDVSRAFAQVRVPVLYLRATRDLLVPKAAGKWIGRLQPYARMIDVDAPHGVLQAAPTASGEAIRSFVESLDPLANCMTASV
jgi:pimeloyl-ACP methyl ester carboxylesterase